MDGWVKVALSGLGLGVGFKLITWLWPPPSQPQKGKRLAWEKWVVSTMADFILSHHPSPVSLPEKDIVEALLSPSVSKKHRALLDWWIEQEPTVSLEFRHSGKQGKASINIRTNETADVYSVRITMAFMKFPLRARQILTKPKNSVMVQWHPKFIHSQEET